MVDDKDFSERAFVCRACIAQKVDLNHFLPLVLSFRLPNQSNQQKLRRLAKTRSDLLQ